MSKVFLALFLFFCVDVSAQYAIGHVSINFKDASRTGGYSIFGGTTFPTGASGRDIGTEIYYPATSTGNNTPIASGVFPLIVFGHGFAMTWDAYTTFFDSMARNGYIIALSRTEGSLLPAPSHLDFGKDLAKIASLFKQLSNESTSIFYQKFSGSVAIGGHSMGGGATFLSDAYADSSVRCYFTFAAAETNPSAIAAATLITRPHLVFGGSYDCVAPPATNQIPMYDTLASNCKTFINLTKAYHCAFADNNFNCGFGEGTCITAGGLSSAVQQRIVRMYLGPYLDYYLKGICPAWQQFQSLLDTATIATVARQCNNVVPDSAAVSGDDFFCNGDSAFLSANPQGFSYSWSNGSVDSVIAITQVGSYAVTVSNSDCSIASTPFPVSEKFLPVTPTVITGDNSLCAYTDSLDVSFNVSGYTGNLVWSFPAEWGGANFINDSTVQFRVNVGGSLWVSTVNECGSGDTVSKELTLLSVPQAQVTLSNDTLFSDTAANYQWYFNGTPIVAADTSFYVPAQSGTYYVEAVSIDGCSDTSEPINFIYSNLSSETFAAFSIFPNPAGDHVCIQVPGLSDFSIDIYDVNGHLVHHSIATGEINWIPVNSFSAGIYLVSVTRDHAIYRTKLLKGMH